MRIVMLGPPGSGKGTYASRLTGILGVPHISTGDMVREEISAKTEIGKLIKGYSDRGELIPDAIMLKMLEDRLKKPDVERGFILDGFPRTLAQAEALEKISRIDLVLNLNVPDWIIIKRLSNRVVCRGCGEIYNLLTLKPKREGVCDKCGGELYQRDDDKPDVIQERLNVYRQKTEPLIRYYAEKGLLRNVYCSSLETPPEVIVEEILKIISQVKANRSC
ncbi:MAG: adenylate kinase [Nitrososphaerota archaeon]|nr:adenylate kinase [Candidatus Bathyarchaeota archaeon]MDW8048628.1 adenylate kinase [Nitrososphaerota archaeon]